ncbi:alpha/beta fold hydrolase [Actinospongicola halichondriae]|uniref:alpha/beta fold hydrolase n=1 Tax=Actinospongicola halichondriae TaxID=3236844 RepID=UPI003D40C4A3
MPTVNVAGQEVHVVDRGSGDPVLFLHAFPFNAAMWEYQYADLEADHRVVGIDLPGFGSSPAPADPKAATMGGWAEIVAGVITELGLERPTVVAASMGGYLTFELIRRHGDLLGPLVLVATRSKSDDVDTWEKRTEQQNALAGGEDIATLAKGMVDNLLSQASLDRPELADYVLALMQHNLPEGWIAALEAMKNRPDAMSALRGLANPTLVVAGVLDRVTPLAESNLISSLVTDGELVIIKDSSHLPNIENPQAFNEAVRAFLAKNAEAAAAPVEEAEPAVDAEADAAEADAPDDSAA